MNRKSDEYRAHHREYAARLRAEVKQGKRSPRVKILGVRVDVKLKGLK
jgi:benzoyl-CoA reductase/2-hydroxyglutaryl-CoA dehydratase subunit BcrC/BadD/HgdB